MAVTKLDLLTGGTFSRSGSLATSYLFDGLTRPSFTANARRTKTQTICSAPDLTIVTAGEYAGITPHCMTSTYLIGYDDTYGAEKVFRSSDGTTWEQIGTFAIALYIFTVNNNRLLTIRKDGTGDAAVFYPYYSDDDGSTWHKGHWYDENEVDNIGAEIGVSNPETWQVGPWGIHNNGNTIVMSLWNEGTTAPATWTHKKQLITSLDNGVTWRVSFETEETNEFKHFHAVGYHSGTGKWIVNTGDGQGYRKLYTSLDALTWTNWRTKVDIAGTLTSRTDNNIGVITVSAGHGLVYNDTVNLEWDGGTKYGGWVLEVTPTTVKVSTSNGTILPDTSTAITIKLNADHPVQQVVRWMDYGDANKILYASDVASQCGWLDLTTNQIGTVASWFPDGLDSENSAIRSTAYGWEIFNHGDNYYFCSNNYPANNTEHQAEIMVATKASGFLTRARYCRFPSTYSGMTTFAGYFNGKFHFTIENKASVKFHATLSPARLKTATGVVLQAPATNLFPLTESNGTAVGSILPVGCLEASIVGSLTARSSTTAGTITLNAGHKLQESDLVDLTWSGGNRYNVTLSGVAATTTNFSGGYGTDLPESGSLPVAITISSTNTIAANLDDPNAAGNGHKVMRLTAAEPKTYVKLVRTLTTVAGTVYVGSIRVKGAVSGYASLTIGTSSSTYAIDSNRWTTLYATFTATGTTIQFTLNFYPYPTDAGSTIDVYVAGLQVQALPYTEWVPGGIWTRNLYYMTPNSSLAYGPRYDGGSLSATYMSSRASDNEATFYMPTSHGLINGDTVNINWIGGSLIGGTASGVDTNVATISGGTGSALPASYDAMALAGTTSSGTSALTFTLPSGHGLVIGDYICVIWGTNDVNKRYNVQISTLTLNSPAPGTDTLVTTTAGSGTTFVGISHPTAIKVISFNVVRTGSTGTLTSKTSASVGGLVLSTNHKLLADTDFVDLIWSGGARYRMAVTAAGANTATVSDGYGSDLPAASAEVPVNVTINHVGTTAFYIEGGTPTTGSWAETMELYATDRSTGNEVGSYVIAKKLANTNYRVFGDARGLAASSNYKLGVRHPADTFNVAHTFDNRFTYVMRGVLSPGARMVNTNLYLTTIKTGNNYAGVYWDSSNKKWTLVNEANQTSQGTAQWFNPSTPVNLALTHDTGTTTVTISNGHSVETLTVAGSSLVGAGNIYAGNTTGINVLPHELCEAFIYDNQLLTGNDLNNFDISPVVTITTEDSQTILLGATLQLRATVLEPEDSPAPTVYWTSDIDGALGTGDLDITTLSAGTHTITATVTDADGLSAYDTISARINATPSVTITTVTEVIGIGSTLQLTADKYDPDSEDVLTVTWESDLYGPMVGTGNINVDTDVIGPGTHVITATVTDSGNLTSTDSITVKVNAPPNIVILTPEQTIVAGTELVLTATVTDPGEAVLGVPHWISSRDGDLGDGTIAIRTLSIGRHIITGRVVDSENLIDDSTVLITVIPAGDTSFNNDMKNPFVKLINKQFVITGY